MSEPEWRFECDCGFRITGEHKRQQLIAAVSTGGVPICPRCRRDIRADEYLPLPDSHEPFPMLRLS